MVLCSGYLCYIVDIIVIVVFKWRHSCIRSMFLCLMLPIRVWFSSAVLIRVLCRSLFWFVRTVLFRFLWTTREFKREKFVTIAKFLITYTTGLSMFTFLCLFCGELVNFQVLWSTGELSCFVVNSWIVMFCGQFVNFHVLWSTDELSCFVVNSWIVMFCGQLVNFHVLWSTDELSSFVVNSWIFMFCGQLVNSHVLWSTREFSWF